MSEPARFELTSALPTRRDGARGERRDRQDVHDRGARRALHRRGREPRRAAARHLHAGRHRRAARAGPRAARLHRARARRARSRAPRRRGEDEIVAMLLRGEPDAVEAAARPARERDLRLRRGDDRDDPRVLPEGARRARHARRSRARRDASSTTSTTSSRRSSTTSTCGASIATCDGRPSKSRREAASRSPGSRSTTRPRRSIRWRRHEASDRAMRRRLAVAARDELERRKRRLALMTFDDQLTRLRDTLTGRNGAAAVAKLRARYRYVLIDEFQDTDPIQWEIVERAFAGGEVTLVLIADPKQAIYAFRGADVYAYLRAAQIGRGDADARRQPPQRPAAARRLRRTVRRRPARPPADRLPARARRRRPTSARGCTARRCRRRCGSASSTAAIRRSSATPSGMWPRRLRRARTSPATSPPTWSRCCRLDARIERRSPSGRDARRAHRRARRHRRAGAHPLDRGAGPPRAARRPASRP